MATERETSLAAMPFVGREAELLTCSAFLESLERPDHSRVLVVSGDSGTGKTELCRRVITVELSKTNDALSIYLNVDPDLYKTSQLFASLVYLAWNPHQADGESTLNVPTGLDFTSYMRQRKLRSEAIGYLQTAASEAAELIPTFGSKLRKLVPVASSLGDPRPDLPTTFLDYLQWASKRTLVFLTLDNYQFLGHEMRLLFEAHCGRMPTNLRCILINRTEEGKSEIGSIKAIFGLDWLHVEHLANLSLSETRSLIAKAHSVQVDEAAGSLLAEDCYLKTRGNLKEIQYYLTSLIRGGGCDSATDLPPGFLPTVGLLPELERRILGLVSLLPAGLDLRYLEAIIVRMVPASGRELSRTLEQLRTLGYIIINSVNGQLLRVAHEKVTTAMRTTMSEGELLELRHSALAAFDSLLARGVNRRRLSYILHCLVGLSSISEALDRLDKVAMLLDLEYRRGNFRYVVSVHQSLPELSKALPSASVKQVLDSLQKTSEFFAGLSLVEGLRRAGFGEPNALALYEAKYLNQLYRYEEADQILTRLPRSPEVDLYRLNVLLCLCRDDEARALVREAIQHHERGEVLFVMHRNTAHLWDYETAIGRLEEALEFFRSQGAEFAQASVLNNWGVVDLWKGRSTEAISRLSQSRDIFARLGSNEIYQPLLNLGAAHLLQQDLETALSFFGDAASWVPQSLLLDQLLLESNTILVELLLGTITLQAACSRMKTLSAEGRVARDPRLDDVLGFNHHNLVGGSPTAWRFRSSINDDSVTGFEVPMHVKAERVPCTVMVALSPHWRY